MKAGFSRGDRRAYTCSVPTPRTAPHCTNHTAPAINPVYCPQVTNFSPIYNPGCSGVGHLPDNKLYTYGGDVGSPPRGMGDGRNKIMVRSRVRATRHA
jgi:hypothetical protein